MRGVARLPELDAYGERIAGLSMRPLRITARTVTPVASNDPVALDAVLAWAMVVEQLQGRPFPRVGGPVWQPLPLALDRTIDDLPLWQSTDFIPEGLSKGMSHIHRRTSDNPYAMRGLQETLREKRPRRFPSELAGPYMNFRVPERRNIAESWSATCVGNKAEVERLLGYVQFFGKASKRGCGFMLDWTVEAMDEPFSFYAGGEALRPIPVEWDTGVGVQQGWTPPYWLKETWRPCISSAAARFV